MAKVQLENITLDYPIYGHNSRSLKSTMMNAVLGGQLIQEHRMQCVKALDNVNITLKEGDRVGLIGHNGAGKSTFLRVVAGIYTPSKGRLTCEGRISSLLDLGLGLEQEYTGYENIYLGGLLYGLTPGEIKDLVPDIASFTELGHYLDLPIKTYSAGMLLRLSFAIATSVSADILLLDEVTGVGDASFLNKTRKRLNNLIHQSQILILTSHSSNILRQFCNKLLWLEHGKVKDFGSMALLDAYEAEAKATA